MYIAGLFNSKQNDYKNVEYGLKKKHTHINRQTDNYYNDNQLTIIIRESAVASLITTTS